MPEVTIIFKVPLTVEAVAPMLLSWEREQIINAAIEAAKAAATRHSDFPDSVSRYAEKAAEAVVAACLSAIGKIERETKPCSLI